MIFVREGIEDLRLSFRDCVQRPDLVVEIDTRTRTYLKPIFDSAVY
jgi:hypothetical protein